MNFIRELSDGYYFCVCYYDRDVSLVYRQFQIGIKQSMDFFIALLIALVFVMAISYLMERLI